MATTEDTGDAVGSWDMAFIFIRYIKDQLRANISLKRQPTNILHLRLQ
jgi:hypothetical protein